MFRNVIISGTIILLIISAASCSMMDKSSPASPNLEPPGATDAGRAAGAQAIMGLWQISIDKYTGEGEITQLRTGDQLLNVLSFMEPPPLKSLTIDWSTLVLDPTNNYLEVVVKFTHPFQEPDNVFMGFDVRGIVFGPELLNVDGYTPALSPQYFSGFPFGYIDGLLGAPNSWAGYKGNMWPYKYFGKGIDPYEKLTDYYSVPSHFDDRGQFPEGATISRFYQLDFGPLPGKFLIFNYAVLASFDWPIGMPVYDLNDFSITTANAPEPFNVTVTVLDNTLYYSDGEGGGMISLDAEVFDWQGAESAGVVVGSFDGSSIPETPAASSEPGTSPYSTIFHFVAVPGTPKAVGELRMYIKATDASVTYGQYWLFGLLPTGNAYYNTLVYNIFPMTGLVEVSPNAPPMWNPVLSLAPGYGTLCRDDNTYEDAYSSYDYTTRWDYTGGEPVDPDGGLMTKWYYISVSPTSQVGSPVGWAQFTTVGYLEMTWQFYTTLAPDRLYLWVRAENEIGETSFPVRWTNDGGEIQLCLNIKAWDNFPPGHWEVGGYLGGCFVGAYISTSVPSSATQDSWIYDNELWTLGDTGTTSEIRFEFFRSPYSWILGNNELSLRVSNDGVITPINAIATWTGTYPTGGPEVVILPADIGGSNTVGSNRAFGFYLDDLSTVTSGVFYVDYVGIYAHPL